MRKNKLLTLVAAFALTISGCSNVNGSFRQVPLRTSENETTYSLTPNNENTKLKDTAYITTLTEFTYSGISWKMNQWNPKTLQIKANQTSATNEFRFYNTSAFSGRITQVVITFSALNVKNDDGSGFKFVGGDSEVNGTTGGTDGTWNSTAKTLTWTPDSEDNYTYFAFYQNGKVADGTNNLASTNAIVVTYESNGGEEPPAPASYSVTYNGNGNTGGEVPTDGTSYTSENNTVTVLGKGTLVREVGGVSYVFSGWNTEADGTGTGYVADSQFTITTNTTLYAQWSEPSKDSGAITYQFKNMTGFNEWNSTYGQRSSNFTEAGIGTLNISLSDAAKPSSGQAIDDIPVMRAANSTIVVKLTSETHYIKAITFHARQWASKTQEFNVCSSTDSGANWSESLASTSTTFVIRASNLAQGTNAIKFVLISSNQTGLEDLDVTYDTLPTVQAGSISFTPSSLSLYGGEQGSFTPTLSGGQGDYEKTIKWISSHPDIIATPADSEAGVAVEIVPAEVATETVVTITGTVDIDGGAQKSIEITVKVIKTISVADVSISGITNDTVLNGENDNTVAVNRKIQFSAEVEYNQGEAYMDGDGEVNWSTSNPEVATINSSGLATLVGNGTVTITATSQDDNAKSKSLSFTVSNIRQRYPRTDSR